MPYHEGLRGHTTELGLCPLGQTAFWRDHYSLPLEVRKGMSEEADALVQGRKDGGLNQGMYNGTGVRGQSRGMKEVGLTGLSA